MPTGPKGQKRPADVIGNAVHVMRIATGQERESRPGDGKDKIAQATGRKGGEARAANMSADDRKQAAKAAAQARWRKKAEA